MTKKVMGINRKGLLNHETITQKLNDLGPLGGFNSLLEKLPVLGYASVEVVGVYDSQTNEISISDKDLDFYQEQIDNILDEKPVEKAVDYKALSEKQAKDNAAMLERFEALEAKFEDGKKPVQVDEDEDLKKQLRAEIKEIGGTTQGIRTVAKLEEKLKELKELNL
jgi:hypothetical protein